MSKVDYNPGTGRLDFHCPACHHGHAVSIHSKGWQWDGDLEQPTLAPAVKVNGHKLILNENNVWRGAYELDAEGNLIPTVCHVYLSEGKLHYQKECTHSLAGVVVDLPEIPKGNL